MTWLRKVREKGQASMTEIARREEREARLGWDKIGGEAN